MSLKGFLRNWSIGSAAIIAVSVAVQSGAGAGPAMLPQAIDPAAPGGQGVNTALPMTNSAVTFGGRGQFTDLQVTVNQTTNLANQAVSITWTGGVPTQASPARFGSHFLQVMQCWGDDDGTNPDNPGPPPEQCVFGATGGTPSGAPLTIYSNGTAVSRIIAQTFWDMYADFPEGVGVREDDRVWRPFRAVDGTVVGAHLNEEFNGALGGGNYWLNPYFDNVTTNELPAAATTSDGRGAELFVVNTGVQSTGLGCGQRVQLLEDGSRTTPKCWIVVVPRGSAAEENVGTYDSGGIITSPLSPAAWQNRIAIPIEFNPVESPCDINTSARRITGSELGRTAMSSWQPALCSEAGLPPFTYSPVSDATARQQLAGGGAGAPDAVVVSRPITATQVRPDNPVVYAPFTLSGITIGFNIERVPHWSSPEEELALTGVRVADLNLTPRLVAKLLTQSYGQSVRIAGHDPGYVWLADNPAHMGLDEDFLRFNPEFRMLAQSGLPMSALNLPFGNSDAAQQVWEWILADPEARAWLHGEPDESGMRVNPVYSTNPDVNPSGQAFGNPLPNSFPKAEPLCYQAPPVSNQGLTITPPALCGTDWFPYARGFADAAQVARIGYNGARTLPNAFPTSAADAWSRNPPQTQGDRTMLSVTDTPSATRLGVQMARLSRAGDNRIDREFIAPTTGALTTGVGAMKPDPASGVLIADPAARVPGAYPLTTLTYVATTPLRLDDDTRLDLADFLSYASSPGQQMGVEPGQLPGGYAPLPAELVTQSHVAVLQVLGLEPAPATTTTTTTTTTTIAPEPTITSTAAASTTTTTTPVAGATTSSSVVVTPTPPFNQSPNTPSGGVTNTTRPSSNGTVTTSASTSTTTTTTVPGSALPTTAAVEVPTGVPPTSAPAVGDEPQAETEAAPILTPLTAVSQSRYAVPGLGVIGLGSALGALEITKRPRRTSGAPGAVAQLEAGE